MANDQEGMQGELFTRFSGPHKQLPFKSKFKLKTRGKVTLVLPYENLVFLIIILIMTFVLSFSLGVEHGKHWANRPGSAFDEPEILAESTSPEQVAAPEGDLKAPQESQAGEVPRDEAQPPASPTHEPFYTIQLITFRQKDTALKELDRLRTSGHEPFISNRQGLYEICVGKYGSAQSAKPVLAQFRQSKWYHDAFLRNLQ